MDPQISLSSSVEFDANPLINPPKLPVDVPALDLVKDEHYLPAIRYGIEKARQNIISISENPEAPTFQNTVEALEFSSLELDQIEHVFSVMSSSNASDALREIEEVVEAEMTRFSNEMFQNEKLFARIKTVYEQKAMLSLDFEQLMLVDTAYKNFVRNGALLSAEQKARLCAVDEELSMLETRFSNNTVKAAEAYRRKVTDEAELDGVPERAKNTYRAEAKAAGLADGTFLLLLEPFPDDVLSHCTHRALREEIYRADSLACYHDEYDNTGLILDIVRLRDEAAKIKGYACHADFVLAERMAGSTKRVTDFLENNLATYKPVAELELQELRDYAFKTDGLCDLKPWDVTYYARKLKEEKFNFQTETLRPYFDLERVMTGLRQHAEKLFKVELREETSGKYPVYHPDVKTFEVYDNASGKQIGLFYADYFARKGSKRGGAWCSAFRERGLVNGVDQMPIAVNTCNFTKPTPEQPSLLSIGDVETVFHEFGHALHALLAEGKYPSLTGYHVKWDFVELPSQLMENWMAEPEVLAGFAHHYQTGEVLPAELIRKMKDGKNFRAGTRGLGQTFYGLLDMAYHTMNSSKMTSADEVEGSVGSRARLIDREFGLNSVGFTHIFSGGYAAGYYSYKWAAGLEADVFAQFKKDGLYASDLSDKLRKTIFSKGGTVDPMRLYVQMMGREPDTGALFRREGLVLPERKVGEKTQPVAAVLTSEGPKV